MIKFASRRASFYSSQLHYQHGFTTRQAGENRDQSAQRAYFQSIAPAPVITYTGHQVHSTAIKRLTSVEEPGIVGDYDGLILPNCRAFPPVIIYVKTADCLSLIVEAHQADLIGVIHVGWQGAYHGILQELANELKQFGIPLSEVKLALGSSINSCCYNIPVMRYEMFKERFGKDVTGFSKTGDRLYFSLPTFVSAELLRLGFAKANLDYRVNCTACQSDYFSYRRQNHTLNRLLTYIANYV